jgi:hypothetical protein
MAMPNPDPSLTRKENALRGIEIINTRRPTRNNSRKYFHNVFHP